MPSLLLPLNTHETSGPWAWISANGSRLPLTQKEQKQQKHGLCFTTTSQIFLTYI